jgi:ABC-2 type transport system permease protein
VDDREHYRTLKYIYIAPVRILFYLLGRGMAKILTTTFAVAITLSFGVLFLQVPLNFSLVNWPLFLLAMITGVVMLTTMGLLLAGVALITVHHSDFLGDAVAGALYLFSGAVFPLEVLPVWLRPVGYALPITYWLELIRRTLVGKVATAFPTFAAFSDAQLFAILIGSSIVFAVFGTLVFRMCDRRARERGLIDRVTNY